MYHTKSKLHKPHFGINYSPIGIFLTKSIGYRSAFPSHRYSVKTYGQRVPQPNGPWHDADYVNRASAIDSFNAIILPHQSASKN
jgi:hypothetical protein